MTEPDPVMVQQTALRMVGLHKPRANARWWAWAHMCSYDWGHRSGLYWKAVMDAIDALPKETV